MPKTTINATTTKPTREKGVVKRKKKSEDKTKKKLKNLKKQLEESYTMLLSGMLLALFQGIEDNVVQQARDKVNEFRHALSESASSDNMNYTTLLWEKVPSAMNETWKVFETGDKGEVWKTFVSGFTKPTDQGEETDKMMMTDPEQPYYDQCVVEGQSQAYDVVAELDSFFEELKSSTPEVDVSFSQAAAADAGQAAS